MSKSRDEHLKTILNIRKERALSDWAKVSVRYRRIQSDLNELAARLDDPMPEVFQRSQDARTAYYDWRSQLVEAHQKQTTIFENEKTRLTFWQGLAEKAVIQEKAVAHQQNQQKLERRRAKQENDLDQMMDAAVMRRALSSRP